jgi:hypothetical protein
MQGPPRKSRREWLQRLRAAKSLLSRQPVNTVNTVIATVEIVLVLGGRDAPAWLALGLSLARVIPLATRGVVFLARALRRRR